MEKMKINNFNGRFFVVTMAIAFLDRLGSIKLDNTMQMLLCTLWIVIAFFQMLINHFKFKGKEEIVFFLKLYMIPHIVIHIYSIILVALGLTEWGTLSSNITVYVPTLTAVMAVYLFKQRTPRYILQAIILSWIISVGINFVQKGPGIFIYAVQDAYFGISTPVLGVFSNCLEIHDLVLSLGYFIVFFIFAKSELTVKNFVDLLAVVLMMILGMKRISLLAILVAIAFNILIKYLSPHKQYNFCKVASVVAFIFCFLYVYVCSEHPEIMDLIVKAGVNMQGRSYYYTAIMQYATFSPTFYGLGRNAVVELLNKKFSYFNIGGVHSDIIKSYVENGFVLFVLWLWYYLRYIISKYREKFGDKAAILCFGITIYTFLMYLTDNVETYCISQMVSIILPMTYALYGNTFKIKI